MNRSDCFQHTVSSESFCFPRTQLTLQNSGPHVSVFHFIPTDHPDDQQPVQVTISNDWELRKYMQKRNQTHGEFNIYGRISRGGTYSDQVENALELMKARIVNPLNEGKLVFVNDLFWSTSETSKITEFVVPEDKKIARYLSNSQPNQHWRHIGNYYSNRLEQTFSVSFSYHDNDLETSDDFNYRMMEIDDEFRSIMEYASKIEN